MTEATLRVPAVEAVPANGGKVPVAPTRLGVLVRQDQALDRTRGGVVIPDMGQERPHSGKILAVGPGAWVDGAWRDPVHKVGQRVIYRRYAGAQIKVDGREYTLLEEHDCLAVVDGDDVAIA